MRDQRRLGAHLVDAVEHRVTLGQQRRDILFSDEFLDAVHPASRMDPGNALPHRQHLGLAERGVQRMHLAVDVALGDMVEVDQRQPADARARQRLGRPRADAADADDADMRRRQPRQRPGAVEPFNAAEAAREV